MITRIAPLALVLFASQLANAQDVPEDELAGPAAPASAPKSNLGPAIADGVEAALRGEKAKAFDRLQRAALISPEHPGLQETLGTAALLLGDRTRARRILERTPSMAVYHAMAELDGAGGISRATTALSRHLKLEGDRAQPAALFLASLAFWRAGQAERAHELLERAVKGAPSALDEAFAPDPAVAMVRSALLALESLPDAGQLAKEARVRFATALFEEERRGEATRLAQLALEDRSTRSAGLRILVLAENALEARRALERVERVISEEPEAQDALVARVVLLVRLGELDRAQRAEAALPPLDVKELSGELARARAAIILGKGGDSSAALDAAEAAVRADPRSDEAVALLVRALIAAKKIERAEAFAGALLKRAPRTVDPFALLAEISDAKRATRRAGELRLRSRGFQAELAKLDRAVRAREEVLRAVRDAETGLGPVGLEAMRGEYPSLSLPMDLGLARGAKPGYARAARERVLNACAPHLVRFLGKLSGWDRTTIALSLYGKAQNVEAPLSGADPARCPGSGPIRRR